MPHSSLALSAGPHRVFIANAEWRRRLTFLCSDGGRGRELSIRGLLAAAAALRR
jgi:hypothetical protein